MNDAEREVREFVSEPEEHDEDCECMYCECQRDEWNEVGDGYNGDTL